MSYTYTLPSARAVYTAPDSTYRPPRRHVRDTGDAERVPMWQQSGTSHKPATDKQIKAAVLSNNLRKGPSVSWRNRFKGDAA